VKSACVYRRFGRVNPRLWSDDETGSVRPASFLFATIRELSRGGANRNAEYGQFCEQGICRSHLWQALTIIRSLLLIFQARRTARRTTIAAGDQRWRFRKRLWVLATLLALVLSDAVMGFYPGFWDVYAAVAEASSGTQRQRHVCGRQFILQPFQNDDLTNGRDHRRNPPWCLIQRTCGSALAVD